MCREDGEGFHARPADRFPHSFFACRASNRVSIVYTGRRSDSALHSDSRPLPSPPCRSLLRLILPQTEPSPRSLSSFVAFFSVSSLRLCSLLTAPLPPHFPFWLTGWTAARSEPQQGSGAEGMRATRCQGHAGRPYCARRAGGLR